MLYHILKYPVERGLAFRLHELGQATAPLWTEAKRTTAVREQTAREKTF